MLKRDFRSFFVGSSENFSDSFLDVWIFRKSEILVPKYWKIIFFAGGKTGLPFTVSVKFCKVFVNGSKFFPSTPMKICRMAFFRFSLVEKSLLLAISPSSTKILRDFYSTEINSSEYRPVPNIS